MTQKVTEMENLSKEVVTHIKNIQEDRKRKIEILQSLDTKRIVSLIEEYQSKLEEALRAETSFRNLNSGFLASIGSDCAEAKRVIAELIISGSGEKMTASQKEAWIIQQRTANQELFGIIENQRAVAFNLENYKIDTEMARRKLENLVRVLELKTAQISFLATG